MYVDWCLFFLQAAALVHLTCAAGEGKEFNFWDMFGGGSGAKSSSTGGVGKGTSTKVPTSRKWGHPPATQPSISRRMEFPVTIRKGDLNAVLKIGSRGQEMVTVLDTGSHHLWVMAEGTTKGECTGFKASQSSTHTTQREQCSSTYGAGTIEGYWGYDTVQLGDGANALVVEKQAMGEANKIDEDMFKDYEAILGLGIMSERAIQGDPEPFLVRLGQIHGKVPPIGIYFNRFNIENSKLIIGGQEEGVYVTEAFSSHTVLPDKEGDYVGWALKIDKVEIKGIKTVAAPAGMDATLDSGATFMMGPEEFVKPINEAIFKNAPAFIKPDSDWRLDSAEFSMEQLIEMYESMPDINIVLNGKAYLLKPDDYIIQSSSKIASGFQVFQQILLGRPFLTKYYARFDYENKKIDLAKATQEQPDDHFLKSMKDMVSRKAPQSFAII